MDLFFFADYRACNGADRRFVRTRRRSTAADLADPSTLLVSGKKRYKLSLEDRKSEAGSRFHNSICTDDVRNGS